MAASTVADPASSNTDNARALSRSVSIAVIIAKGMVWVSPIRFPANIRVAPNSDKARAQARPNPVITEGPASGNVVRQKVAHGDTPRVCETSS